MLSIGWVMFWKAVVLAVFAVAADRWSAFKQRYRAKGITLRRGKDGVYKEPIGPERIEQIAVKTFKIVLVLFILYAALIVYWLVTGPK